MCKKRVQPWTSLSSNGFVVNNLLINYLETGGRPRSDNSISEWNMGTNNLRANTGISGNGGATHGGSPGVLASTPITTVHRGAGGDSVDRTRNRNQSSQVEQSERIRFCPCSYWTILTIKITSTFWSLDQWVAWNVKHLNYQNYPFLLNHTILWLKPYLLWLKSHFYNLSLFFIAKRFYK